MRKRLPLLFAFFTLLSCHKNSDKAIPDPPIKDSIPVEPPVVDTVDKTHVYISGYDLRKAFYWKDSTLIFLTDGSNSATATAVFVKDTDVYVAGSEIQEPGAAFAARYWKNGIPVSLTDGSRYATATGIYVDQQNNVYVSGWENSDAGFDTHWVAKYWVNGKAYVLSDSMVNDGVATAIVADNEANVYVSWWQFSQGGQRLGFYNKNKEKHLLNKEGFDLFPLDIVQENGNAYVVGFTNNGYGKSYAGYWKNGHLEIIDSLHQAWPSFGFVSQDDIYLLGGWDRTSEIIWHNGTKTPVTITPSDMFVFHQDVYISGSVYSPATDYFVPAIYIQKKEGFLQRELPLEDGLFSPVATGIFVK